MPMPGQTRVGATSASGTMLQSDDSVLDVASVLTNIAARLSTAGTSLAQIVTNTGGTDAVNLESIMTAVERAVLDIRNAAIANKTSQEATQAAVEALRALTVQLVTGEGTAYMPILLVVRNLLATIDADTGGILTSVQLIDNAIGTHGADVSTAIVATGSKAETGVPAAVADGEDVRDNRDEYGRARSAEFDPATGTAQTTDTAPAQMQKSGPRACAQLTDPGSTAESLDIVDYENVTAMVTVDIGGCTTVVVGIECSLDAGTTYGLAVLSGNTGTGGGITIAGCIATITASGTYCIRVSGEAAQRARGRFVTETDDTDGTVDFVLMAGN